MLRNVFLFLLVKYHILQERVVWEEALLFRDCNGESNGKELPLRTLQVECAAAETSCTPPPPCRQSWTRGWRAESPLQTTCWASRPSH